MRVGQEPVELEKPDFFSSLPDYWKNNPPVDYPEAVLVPKKYQCPECKEIREDEDGQKVIQGKKELFELICQPCEDEKKYNKRLAEFYEGVPTLYKKEMKFDKNPSLLTSKSSVIFGAYGTGKTWTAYSIAKELYMSGKINSFKIVREIQIINDLRDNPVGGYVYTRPDLLVIDEFGKVNDTDFTKAQIFNIIDERHDWDKQTILICNATNDKEIKQILPEAIQDRYKGCVVFMGGNSRR